MWELTSNDFSDIEYVSIDSETNEMNEINLDDLYFNNDLFDDADKNSDSGEESNANSNVQTHMQTKINEIQKFLIQNNKDAQRQNMKLKFLNSLLKLAKKYNVTLNQVMLNQLCLHMNFSDNQNNANSLDNEQLKMNMDSKKSTKNIKFSDDEDKLLKDIVEKIGASRIKPIVNNSFAAFSIEEKKTNYLSCSLQSKADFLNIQ